ncbi:MAG: sugar/nucleoside kinase (ribokinase family) [Verrucomicrobiales bacterium]|jgi:sugar/nucleoside kinase (ribokinase family)
MPKRHGLLAAGNFIIDHVKMIDDYPAPEMLTNIRSRSSSNGGGPYNVLKDLAKMEAPFPLEAVALIGKDADGDWIVADCEEHAIATWGLERSDEVATSYTDAMTVAKGGQRTFFHHRGANAIFSEDDIDFARSHAKWFYLGYLLLLDSLDEIREDGKTGASIALERACAAGFRTVIDFVSVPDPRVRAIAEASLPYVDVLFINEIEAGMVLDTDLRHVSGPDLSAMERAAAALLEMGVHEAVIIHFQEGALAMTKDGQVTRQGAVQVPEESIVGSTGAGDAFAAGVFFGLHEDWPLQECLELGVCSAAISLGAGPPSVAMIPARACLEQGRGWGFRNL